MTEKRDQEAATGHGDLGAPILLRASLLYLCAPLFAFLAFWLRAGVAAPAVLLLAWALWRGWQAQRVPRGALREWAGDHRWILAGMVVYLGAAVWYCGIGGMAEQNWDWQKHNAVLQALVTNPWPAWVELEDGSRPLVYYLAFYLLPAGVGRLTQSWLWTNLALYAWALAGVLLAFLWFARIAGRLGTAVLALFLLMSGAEYLGHLLHELILLPWQGRVTFWILDFEWWPERLKLQYSSVLTVLAWVPQHGIGGWIAAGAAWHLFRTGDLSRWTGVLLVAALAWSPFVAVGIAVFAFMNAVLNRDWRWASPANAATLPLMLVLILFYGSVERHAEVVSGFSGLYFFLPRDPAGSPLLYVLNWLMINGVEAGLPAAAAWWAGVLDRQERKALVWLLGGLLVNSLFVVGANNDWAMRTSIPALFVLYALLTRALLSFRPSRRRSWLAVGVFAAGLVVPFQQASWLLPRNHTRPSATLPLHEVEDFRITGTRDGLQRVYYFGDPQRPFFRLLGAPRP